MKIKVIILCVWLAICSIGYTWLSSVSSTTVETQLSVNSVNGGAIERANQETFYKNKGYLKALFPVGFLVGTFIIFRRDLKKLSNKIKEETNS